MQTDIIVAIIGLIGVIFASQGFWTWLVTKNQKKTNVNKLLLGIAYSKIIQLCEYHIERGYVTADEYHELNHYLYAPYKEMGGNGTAEAMIQEVMKLPKKKEGGANE